MGSRNSAAVLAAICAVCAAAFLLLWMPGSPGAPPRALERSPTGGGAGRRAVDPVPLTGAPSRDRAHALGTPERDTALAEGPPPSDPAPGDPAPDEGVEPARMEAHVYDAFGALAGRSSATAERPDGTRVAAETLGPGHFRWPKLPPDAYRLLLRQRSAGGVLSTAEFADVTLAPGEVLMRDWVLPDRSLTVALAFREPQEEDTYFRIALVPVPGGLGRAASSSVTIGAAKGALQDVRSLLDRFRRAPETIEAEDAGLAQELAADGIPHEVQNDVASFPFIEPGDYVLRVELGSIKGPSGERIPVHHEQRVRLGERPSELLTVDVPFRAAFREARERAAEAARAGRGK